MSSNFIVGTFGTPQVFMRHDETGTPSFTTEKARADRFTTRPTAQWALADFRKSFAVDMPLLVQEV